MIPRELAHIWIGPHPAPVARLNDPWHSTGNGFLRRFFGEHPEKKEGLKVFPSHFFIPEHHKTPGRYSGPDTVYAEQMWATTLRGYDFRKSPTAEYKAATAERSAKLYADLLDMTGGPLPS